MKKVIFVSLILTLGAISSEAWSLAVYSVNGFVCQKSGFSVTCKGPIPGNDSHDAITATGHGLVYISMDVTQGGVPTRYTYFSDTGCLVGYTFGTEGKVVNAVAVHRNGSKASFPIDNDNYDQMVTWCEQELPNSPRPLADTFTPKSAQAAPAPAKSVAATPTSAPAPKKTP
jgi:hypothetical protein